jgi:hypothetical protein
MPGKPKDRRSTTRTAQAALRVQRSMSYDPVLDALSITRIDWLRAAIEQDYQALVASGHIVPDTK